MVTKRELEERNDALVATVAMLHAKLQEATVYLNLFRYEAAKADQAQKTSSNNKAGVGTIEGQPLVPDLPASPDSAFL